MPRFPRCGLRSLECPIIAVMGGHENCNARQTAETNLTTYTKSQWRERLAALSEVGRLNYPTEELVPFRCDLNAIKCDLDVIWARFKCGTILRNQTSGHLRRDSPALGHRVHCLECSGSRVCAAGRRHPRQPPLPWWIPASSPRTSPGRSVPCSGV